MFETNASTDSAIRANLSVGLLDLLNRDGMHAASGALSGSSLYSGRPEIDLSRKGIANYAKKQLPYGKIHTASRTASYWTNFITFVFCPAG